MAMSMPATSKRAMPGKKGKGLKVYISVDMEGIGGVVNWDETGREGLGDYDRARKLMAGEVNAAIEGALAAGATEILVNDSHSSMRNLIIEDLNPAARLISGSPKPMSMMEGLDDSYAAAFFVGYHARATTLGVLNHTYTGSLLEYRVNGQVLGETGMNAATAGDHGVPVVLVTGDGTVCTEARALLNGVETVAVKEHIGRYAANNLHPTKSRALIKEAAERALKGLGKVKPLKIKRPVRVELKFNATSLADGACLMPGVERVDDLTAAWEGPDYVQAVRAARAMITLAGRS
ncbi:MAG: M55 family metallopeptidase [Bacillota bacterium]